MQSEYESRWYSLNSMIPTKPLNTLADRKDPVSGAVPLTPDASRELLASIVGSAKGHCLAFDLDSTLLNNRPRNAVIMREFAVAQNEPQLGEADAVHFKDWSASNAMRSIGLPDEKIEQIVDNYWAFWQERFFTSDYCQHDVSVPGASEFVSSIEQAGGMVYYLTGRHEGMRAGTEASLKKLGFPNPGDGKVQLLMKPQQDQSDDLFKVEALQKLDSKYPLLAAFDNEPTHINSYRSAFPEAVCVHLFTDHSNREVQLLDKIYSIFDFI